MINTKFGSLCYILNWSSFNFFSFVMCPRLFIFSFTIKYIVEACGNF